MIYLGDVAVGATVRVWWSSQEADGSSVTRATNGTISVYKDGSDTPDTSGITDSEDINSVTGVHRCSIDLSSDGTFYSAGSDFAIVLSGATIDGATVNAVLAQFSIANRPVQSLASGVVTAAALAADAVDEILDDVIEGTLTLRQAMRLIVASSAGKLSGAATTSIVIRDTTDAKDRITATVDADGNRSALTYDVS